MSSEIDAFEILGRVIGAIVIGAATFVFLWYWDSWNLSLMIRFIISAVAALLYAVIGGSVWRWVSNIDLWS
jgi:hypothetical protein